MKLTVGILKKILSELDEDVILADLGIGNFNFNPYIAVKRLLLLQGNDSWRKQKFLTINRLGSHWGNESERKEGLEFTGKYWDENTLKASDCKQEKEKKNVYFIRCDQTETSGCVINIIRGVGEFIEGDIEDNEQLTEFEYKILVKRMTNQEINELRQYK